MTGSDPARDRPNLRRAARYLLPYRRQLAAVLAISLTGTALTLYLPLLSRGLVDDALLGQDMAALVRIVSLFLLIPLISFVLNVISGMIYTALSANILFDMRVDVYAHLQRLSPRFFAVRPLGDIVSRLNSDIAEIQRILAESALGWVTSSVYLLGTVGMLVYLDWRLFLVSVVLLPPSVWALVVYRRKLEASVRAVREKTADIGAFLIETIQAVKLVVSSNAQAREIARFRGKNDDFVRALLSMRWLTYLAGGLPGLILVVSTGVVFLYGGFRVIDEVITLGTFVAFMAYQMRVMQPVRGLMGLYANLASVEVSLRRVDELLDTEPEVVEMPGAVALERVKGTVTLDSVSVSFGRGSAVLENVNLEVGAGETVAIVGPSERERKIDDRRPHGPAARSRPGTTDPRGWRGHPHADPGKPSGPPRSRRPGALRLQRLGGGEHPLRPTRCLRRGGDGGGSRRRSRRLPRLTARRRRYPGRRAGNDALVRGAPEDRGRTRLPRGPCRAGTR